MYDALMAETIRFAGHGGDLIEGYLARPLGPGPYVSLPTGSSEVLSV